MKKFQLLKKITKQYYKIIMYIMALPSGFEPELMVPKKLKSSVVSSTFFTIFYRIISFD